MFTILYILLVPLFIVYLIVSLKFQFGEEGKDERGMQILNRSYMYSSPIFPIGWLLVEVVHSYLHPLTIEEYRDVFFFIILLTFIIQGLVISIYKKRI
ncbi:hypothetical protein ACFFGV_04705 [Pontibacillus salicampi]|uniref:Uncharacterized protein n=1 Tax=Pontibacillus salicampi TaxID=1449801 RepID=A0ABV6LKG4_9BACI